MTTKEKLAALEVAIDSAEMFGNPVPLYVQRKILEAEIELEEVVAFELWKHEADRAAPNVGRNRTMEGFAEQSPQTREKWLGLARAAIDAIEAVEPVDIPEVTEAQFKEARLVTPAERARRYMGQIMAECDCPQEVACEVAGRCLSLNQTCAKCGGEMEAGYALEQTFTAGAPDFPGSDRVTMSAGGPGKMVPCRKCKACGWSVTV